MITVKEKYNNAKLSAKQRNIEWLFDFDSWIEWWGNDLHLRGPKKGNLVMARFNDQGPYHPNNVKKITVEENIREMRIRVKGNNRPVGSFSHSIETKNKMSTSRKGRNAWNKGLAGKGICKAWNKGLNAKEQIQYRKELKGNTNVATI